MILDRRNLALEVKGNGIHENFDNMAIPPVRNFQIWRSANNPIVNANDFTPKYEISAIIMTSSINNEKPRWLRYETLKYEAE